MQWPGLMKAKKNLKNLEIEVDNLLKNHNSLTKKELARQHILLLEEFDSSMDLINGQLQEFAANIKSHRKYLAAKHRFIKRHYKNV